MNGRVAKKIRKMVYGEGSRRVQEYGIIRHFKSYFVTEEGKRKEKQLVSGQLVCQGRRAKYKASKKAYRRGELVLPLDWLGTGMDSCKNHPTIRARKNGLCDECLAAGEAKAGQSFPPSAPSPSADSAAPKARRGRKPRAPAQDGTTCMKVDFSGYPEILERIREMASNQFRTVEGQILSLLDSATNPDD